MYGYACIEKRINTECHNMIMFFVLMQTFEFSVMIMIQYRTPRRRVYPYFIY